MASRRLEVIIDGNASSAVRALGQTSTAVDRFDDRSSRAAGRFSQTWRTGISNVGRSIGGLVAGAGLAMFFSSAVTEAEEAASVMRKTEAVIESTGGVAGVTADHLEGLAGRLSDIAAVDDEVIQSAGNVMLTFKNIKAEGGIFDAAMESALDMSAALDIDLQSATMNISKALNDPIEGLGKLARAGVDFTDQQKDQIAMMVYFGDTAGAQRIILDELATQFGGAAEANATASEKMTVAMDNIKESVGTLLLPALGQAADAVSGLADWFTNLPESTQTAIAAIAGVTAVALIMWATLGGPVTAITIGIGAIVGALWWLGEEFPELKRKAMEFFDSLPARWEEIMKDLKPLREDISRTFEGFKAFIDNLDFTTVTDQLKAIGDNLQSLKDQLGITSSNGRIAMAVLGFAIMMVTVFIQGTIIAAKQAATAVGWLGAVSLKGLQFAILLVQSFLSGVTSAAKTAMEWLKKFGSLNVSVPGLGSVRDLLSSAAGAAKDLYGALSNLVSRTFSVKVDVPLIGKIGFGESGHVSVPRGPMVVGEGGPEIVQFRGGERLYNNADSRRMVAGGRGGGASIVVNIHGRASASDGQEVVDALKRWMGGNGPVPIRVNG